MPKTPARNCPQSRLYWELKAEQVLNRVFQQTQAVSSSESEGHISEGQISEGQITDVEILDLPSPYTNWRPVKPKQSPITLWLTICVASIAGIFLVVIMLGIKQLQSLEQERNFALLRQLLPEGGTPGNNIAQDQANHGIKEEPQLPTPPSEAWMEELAKLPESENSAQQLLRVPLHGPLSITAPALSQATIGERPLGDRTNPLPLLVGIIQGAAGNSAAIFEYAGSSTSVNSGETIGTSGWLLRRAEGDSAIIERGGQQRRISINGSS